MSNDDIEKLIGGYATDSLTREERQQLFEAALDDQELFDALQKEQALKELFADPVSRDEISRAVADSLPARPERRRPWFRQPWMWAAAGSLAAAVVTGFFLLQPIHQTTPAVTVAQTNRPVVQTPPPVSTPLRASEPGAVSSTPEKPTMQKREEHRAQTLAENRNELSPALERPPSAPSLAPSLQAQQSVATGQVAQESQAADQAQQAPERQSFAPRQQAMRDANQAQSGGAIVTQMAKSSASAPVTRFALKAAPRFSFTTRMVDGTYAPSAGLHTGDNVRLTIIPWVSGPIVVSTFEPASQAWTSTFPSSGRTVQVTEGESFTVPIDIPVKSGGSIEVKIGNSVERVPISVR